MSVAVPFLEEERRLLLLLYGLVALARMSVTGHV